MGSTEYREAQANLASLKKKEEGLKVNLQIENKQKEQPTTSTYITDNDYDDGSWLENYTEINQIEPEYFIYQNKYKVYRCGKTLYMKNI